MISARELLIGVAYRDSAEMRLNIAIHDLLSELVTLLRPKAAEVVTVKPVDVKPQKATTKRPVKRKPVRNKVTA